jgi:outer membrane protein assembly factor BamB
MNETPNPGTPVIETPTATPDPKLPRLRLPVIFLLLYWVLTFAGAAVDKPYFVGFIYGLLCAFLVTAVLLGWWWFNRSVPLLRKLLGFVLVLAGAAIVRKLAHPSVSPFTLWMVGFPILGTLLVAWLIIAKRRQVRSPWLGAAAVVTLAWAGFLLIRIEGADSRLKFGTHWRWTPTPEEQFLASSQRVPSRPSNADTNATVVSNPEKGDWDSFRGPERDGVVHHSSVGTNWALHPPTLVWRRAVGPAWSSVLVVGSRLYTQEQRAAKETVVCYDADKGDQLWIHEDTARFNEQVSGPGPRATPTFYQGRLYSLGGTGWLDCLNAATGALLWQRDVKEESGAKVPTWAFASSPLVAGDTVIVYAGGDGGKGVLAFRAATGELLWSAPAGASSYSSPQLTAIAGQPQCLVLHDGGLTSLDLATGKKLWETGAAMKGAPRTGQPRLMDGNKLLVAALGGLGTSLIEVTRNGDAWSASDKWDSKALKPEFPDFVVYQGHAFGFDVGIFCCIDLADGQRCWKEGRYGRGQALLLADQGLLLVSTESGELVLLAADPAAHRELGRFQALEGKTWNHPVVRASRVYHRNAQEMACYRLAD